MPASTAISSGIFNTLAKPASPTAAHEAVGLPRCIGLKGISVLGGTSWDGISSIGRHLQVGASESLSQGYISPPSLQLSAPGFWRFRWTVTAGTHTVSAYVMQPANLAPFPTLTVQANPAIGVNSDVTVTAPGGGGWVLMGPASITASLEGVLWVLLWNNLCVANSPAYYGQISVT